MVNGEWLAKFEINHDLASRGIFFCLLPSAFCLLPFARKVQSLPASIAQIIVKG
jgi:hypothetical protein